MSNIDPEEKCEKCKHFEKTELGECRKYAPHGGKGRPWSHVRKTQWCSEFEKTKDAVPASDLANQNAKKPNSLKDVSSGKEIIE